jgi:hypothetical protein
LLTFISETIRNTTSIKTTSFSFFSIYLDRRKCEAQTLSWSRNVSLKFGGFEGGELQGYHLLKSSSSATLKDIIGRANRNVDVKVIIF